MAFPLFAPRRLAEGLPTNTRSPTVLGSGAAVYPRGREVAALVIWTCAIFIALALASYQGEPASAQVLAPDAPRLAGPNWAGFVGEACARALVTAIGVVAWVVPVELALLGVPFVRGRRSAVTPTRVAGDVVIVVLAAALVQVGWPTALAFGRHGAAGLVGELFGELFRSLFSTVGSFLVGFAALGIILIVRATFSFIALVNGVGRIGRTGAERTAAGARQVASAWRAAREVERQKAEQARISKLPRIDTEAHDDALVLALPEPGEEGAGDEEALTFLPLDPPKDAAAAKSKRARARIELGPEPAAPTATDPGARARGRRKKDAAPTPDDDDEPDVVAEVVLEDAVDASEDASAGRDEDADEERGASEGTGDDAGLDRDETEADETDGADDAEPGRTKPRRGKGSRRKKAPPGPTIVDTTAALQKMPPARHEKDEKRAASTFSLPRIDFLSAGAKDGSVSIDEEGLRRDAELLVRTLAYFKVVGTVEEIHPGPVVTTFELLPEAGTKVARVAGLVHEVTMAFARKVRIVAPIPGKNRIGFELENLRRAVVNLRDLVEDRRFQSLDAALPLVLGRDIVGNPVYADLATMPHVIVAGATGAGKSVGLNVMLASLLYRRTPDELRLLMIDPKVVELAPFDRIPHMLLPVVTDMKQASNALKWAVDEMERRYQLFADAGTKNIGTYNGWVGRVRRGEAKNPAQRLLFGKDPNGFVDAVPARDGEGGEQPLPEALPLIVIVVDEYADLVMQYGKEVEASIARLAQKSRAAGMHVILATQRPSVDVITGMIKANFPTRIAFKVAQKIDSGTILDERGAEHLLGKGDMLIKLYGTNETRRVQCPWISEEEVLAVTDHLRAQGEPVYDENIIRPRDDEDGEGQAEDGEQDAMYDQAVAVVTQTGKCTISWLQRKLGLGYNRAAKIVETMERRGIVGPANGAKEREILVSNL